MTTEMINGVDVTPAIGRWIKPDGWTLGECLVEGDSFSQFRLPTGSLGPIKSLAVRIELSGRTLQRKFGNLVVRVRIIFVGDCEPDTICYGYMGV